ncbi:MAG: acetyl-coenzyme A synthetase N-terminal domain-containing protein [Limisphaerales bacterium]
MTTPSKTISTQSLSNESRTFPPSPEVKKRALLNAEQFNALYEQSIREPEKFWLEQAKALEWIKFPTVAGKHTWDTAAKKNRAYLVRRRPVEFERELPGSSCQNQNCATKPLLFGKATARMK